MELVSSRRRSIGRRAPLWVMVGLEAGFMMLFLACAQKTGCNRIYTFNVRDFRSLAPSILADKISAP